MTHCLCRVLGQPAAGEEQNMCLALPAQLVELPGSGQPLATAELLGVRRKISLDLLADDPPMLGDWVLVHVGFAMARISAERAQEQLELLRRLGELETARDEVQSGTSDVRPATDDPAAGSEERRDALRR
jgi:hydrogenase expression/formation protein HypC